MIPANSIIIAKAFEGYFARPYICPAGIATIGWGATRYPDGRRVMLQDPPVTEEEAMSLLLWELEGCSRSVSRLCPALLTDEGRFGAIVDFAFNLGAGRLQASTLRRKINQLAWDEVPGQLLKWVYGGGRKLPGLVRRRQAEAVYFLLQ